MLQSATYLQKILPNGFFWYESILLFEILSKEEFLKIFVFKANEM
jgi:hypothetical protein